MNRARREGALDDDIGFLEARLDVAQLVHHGAGDVRGLAFEAHEVVQYRCARLDRVLDLDRVRQDFVVHLDQLAGFGRDFLIDRGDRGNGMAVEQRLLARHDVA